MTRRFQYNNNNIHIYIYTWVGAESRYTGDRQPPDVPLRFSHLFWHLDQTTIIKQKTKIEFNLMLAEPL